MSQAQIRAHAAPHRCSVTTAGIAAACHHHSRDATQTPGHPRTQPSMIETDITPLCRNPAAPCAALSFPPSVRGTVNDVAMRSECEPLTSSQLQGSHQLYMRKSRSEGLSGSPRVTMEVRG